MTGSGKKVVFTKSTLDFRMAQQVCKNRLQLRLLKNTKKNEVRNAMSTMRVESTDFVKKAKKKTREKKYHKIK